MLNFESPYAVGELTGADLEWIRAIRAVQEAIDAFEDAGSALIPLMYESEWQASGVRALHDLIVDLRNRTAVEIGELGARRWEIESRPTP